MKRSIIFLSILVTLMAGAIASEYFYSKSLKSEAKSVIEEYRDADSYEAFEQCAKKLKDIVDHRKVINMLFYSRDITQKMLSEIEKMNLLASGDNIADASAQLESVKYLFDSIYRFNANQ